MSHLRLLGADAPSPTTTTKEYWTYHVLLPKIVELRQKGMTDEDITVQLRMIGEYGGPEFGDEEIRRAFAAAGGFRESRRRWWKSPWLWGSVAAVAAGGIGVAIGRATK